MANRVQEWMHHYVTASGFARKYRYYAAVLSRLVPVESQAIDVMAVEAIGAKVYLHINVDFFVNNFQYVWGVLLHEVNHVVLGHLSNPRLRQAEDWPAMELAMEISANEYIQEPLPGNPPIWRHFSDLGVAPGQSSWERYELLAKARARRRPVSILASIDTHLPRGVGKAVALTALDVPLHHRIARLVRDAVAGAEREMGDGSVLAGRSPGQVLEQLEDIQVESIAPRIDWKQALRAFVCRRTEREPRFTYDRPNRRFPTLAGIVPARLRRCRRDQLPRLLVVVDTSGSMQAPDLALIARELEALADQAQFTIVECDAAIQRVYPFEGKIESFQGRGGTDLRPPFEPAFLADHGPVDGVVYFTDGCGPYSEEAPSVPTLWALTNPDLSFACPWGRQVLMRQP
jgi:predicted metal-dependent peptidase